MSTSKTTAFLSEIVERKPIPANKLAYFQARLKHNLYDFILQKFEEKHETEGLTKAELARRIGCEPALISRRLGAPGNWTLDTVSDLLIGIAGEELSPQSEPLVGRAKRNYDGSEWRIMAADESGTSKPKAKLSEPKARRTVSAATAGDRRRDSVMAASANSAISNTDILQAKKWGGPQITGSSKKPTARAMANT